MIVKKAEIWKVFPDNDDYLISSFGRVFNKRTNIFIKSHFHKSRSNYYRRAQLGKRKYMVHILVARTFLWPPPTDKHQVDHLDGNTLNNNLDNLEWVTQSENIKRCYERKKIPIIS